VQGETYDDSSSEEEEEKPTSSAAEAQPSDKTETQNAPSDGSQQVLQAIKMMQRPAQGEIYDSTSSAVSVESESPAIAEVLPPRKPSDVFVKGQRLELEEVEQLGV